MLGPISEVHQARVGLILTEIPRDTIEAEGMSGIALIVGAVRIQAVDLQSACASVTLCVGTTYVRRMHAQHTQR